MQEPCDGVAIARASYVSSDVMNAAAGLCAQVVQKPCSNVMLIYENERVRGVDGQ